MKRPFFFVLETIGITYGLIQNRDFSKKVEKSLAYIYIDSLYMSMQTKV